MTDFIVCWSVDDEEYWEVIDGEDAMQERVDRLVDCGVNDEDIVIGQLWKDDV